jgi:preprotein translocase subunit SecG
VITFITIVHVVVCLFLILVILLQAGKGGGLGLGAGGGGSQTVFGARGSQSFLGRVTSISAGIFMLTSVYLAINSTRSTFGNIPEVETPAQQAPASGTAPAAPADGSQAEKPPDAKPPQPADGATK